MLIDYYIIYDFRMLLFNEVDLIYHRLMRIVRRLYLDLFKGVEAMPLLALLGKVCTPRFQLTTI